MAANAEQHTGLVKLLLEDHQEVRDLFDRFKEAGEDEWGALFSTLTNHLVRHEVAEEEILYPEVRRALPDGDLLADARITEQSEAEKLLAQLEGMGPGHEDFPTCLARLRLAVLDHASQEERHVFPPLAEALEPDRMNQLGQRYEKAKAAAPTHPHPHAPDKPPGNLILGPVAALVDRLRDVMRST